MHIAGTFTIKNRTLKSFNINGACGEQVFMSFRFVLVSLFLVQKDNFELYSKSITCSMSPSAYLSRQTLDPLLFKLLIA